MRTHIATLADYHKTRRGSSKNESFVANVIVSRRGSLLPPVRGSLSDTELPVEVNHGRWIVNCPFCPGAELADPDDPRFFCLSCGNADANHEWLRVRWPVDKEVIEAVLLARPKDETQNWKEGEPVDKLQAENESRGLREEI